MHQTLEFAKTRSVTLNFTLKSQKKVTKIKFLFTLLYTFSALCGLSLDSLWSGSHRQQHPMWLRFVFGFLIPQIDEFISHLLLMTTTCDFLRRRLTHKKFPSFFCERYTSFMLNIRAVLWIENFLYSFLENLSQNFNFLLAFQPFVRNILGWWWGKDTEKLRKPRMCKRRRLKIWKLLECRQ